jgi:hypothetical protein
MARLSALRRDLCGPPQSSFLQNGLAYVVKLNCDAGTPFVDTLSHSFGHENV